MRSSGISLPVKLESTPSRISCSPLAPRRANRRPQGGGRARFGARRPGRGGVLPGGRHGGEFVRAGAAGGRGIAVGRFSFVRPRLKTRRRGLKRAQQRSAIELPND